MKIILISSFLIFSAFVFSQKHLECKNLQAVGEYENVFSQQIASDSLVSSFVIWIKKEVKEHKHEFHSEHVYVLEGTAEMTLNEQHFTIKAGDFIFIPKNTWHYVKVTSNEPLKVLSIQAPTFDGKDRVLK